MTTKGEMVDAAYEEIALAGYIFDVTADERVAALKRMDRMLSSWEARGIRLGYKAPIAVSSDSLNDTVNIPDWAEFAVYTNLALHLAPTLGKNVHPDTRKAAREGYRTLLMGNYNIPRMQMPRHMPIGLGNRRNTKNQQFFSPVDRVTTTNDATLEPSGNPWPDSN